MAPSPYPRILLYVQLDLYITDAKSIDDDK
jgi:hypothetical protein